MAFACGTKLKITFFLLVVTYFLFTLLGVFEIKYSFTPSHQAAQHNYTLSVNISGYGLRYCNTNLTLREAGPAQSIDELDYLLNIRKLIVFAVHELNEPLKYKNCANWWANPLDLISHEEISKSATHVVHLIKFHIQPGDLQLVVPIRQQVTPIGIDDKELEIIGDFEIVGFNGCKRRILWGNSPETCLCPGHEHFEMYNAITHELRKQWNNTDRELITWHPDKSFSVTDYMNFAEYDFITSPGRTIQDIATISYSTEYCGPDIKMLVMVSSAPGHFQNRKVIRETYGNPSNLEGKGIKVVFLMGVPSNETLNEEVKREADVWKDIIQANFEDSYHNLTISHLSMYKWAHLTCIKGKSSGVTVPPFILKADDDFVLDPVLALKVAQQNSEHEFIGCLFCSGKAVRDLAYMKKYYTPRYMHISNTYAGYLSGVAYVMRTDLIPRLLHMSITTPIIHMDDAYITGVLLRQLSISPKGSPYFTYTRVAPDVCNSKHTAASHALNLDDMIVQWKSIVKPKPSYCTGNSLKLKVPELSDTYKRHCFFK